MRSDLWYKDPVKFFLPILEPERVPTERPHMLLLMRLIKGVPARRCFHFSDPEINAGSHA